MPLQARDIEALLLDTMPNILEYLPTLDPLLATVREYTYDGSSINFEMGPPDRDWIYCERTEPVYEEVIDAW